jgi:excinuclease ABC subunit C
MEDQGSTARRGELLEKAKEAPKDPGVYLMKDATGLILYVGKAKNLKNRLSSYFQRGAHEVLRTEFLVQKIEFFDVILTETESEALILECTLIKKHKPRYNVRLKDDKQYPYLKVRANEPFPRVEWTRKVKRDGARYFGPFPSSWGARNTLQLLNEFFQLRDCSDNTFRHRSRPCIQYQIQKCTAPCVAYVTESQYRDQIERAIQVLEGKDQVVEKELTAEMNRAAAEEEFELAAFYRDRLQSLADVTAIQSVDDSGKTRNRDVVAVARAGASGHVAVLQIRGGKLLSVRHIRLSNTDDSQPDAELLGEFLSQYYLSLEGEKEKRSRGDSAGDGEIDSTPDLGRSHPSEILVRAAPKDLELIEKTCGLTVLVPADEKDFQLMNVAETNAKHALEQAKKTEEGHGLQALEEVQSKCHLSKTPLRIECYDISNFQGEDSVASRVVFMEGAPDKNLYRRYKIRTVEGQNDFAMMREVLGRRFSNSDEELPDLVVVDGGKGQLSQAVQILRELDLEHVPVVGLAKARTESDFQATEVESSLERIFIPGRKNPVPLQPHMKAYKLLTHIRDEAHRFAITYHRNVRDKRSLGNK